MPAITDTSTSTVAITRPRDLPPALAHEWHWPEYGAEFAGTCWNVFVGLSAVVCNFAPGMPGSRMVPDASLRLWITGLIFAGSGSLFTISPWGRLSGAHLNPSVTLAFWASGKMRGHDLFGYLGAQLLGGTFGASLIVLVWGAHAAAVNNGMTLPGPGISDAAAFGTEALMTFAYVMAIFVFVSHRRLLRWTPLMNWLVVSGLVWLAAAATGTSLNPARSLGPALVSWHWRDQWIYWVAPPLGGTLAAVVFPLLAREREILTGKLFRSGLYRSIFQHCALANHPPLENARPQA